ncbi:MAG: redox-regulated ATPase YchF [Actinobacteria bacterium]|nr:redox-regulated ATPase YchF [Actinomycetota bacterium]
MSLSVGIVGLPNVGKSTLFRALTRQQVAASNYPFCTIDPNVGVVPVPDSRLDRINEIVRPERLVPAVVEFVDIAGLVKGASRGEGLGNQFLAHIRECDAICEVLRAFGDPDVAHVEGRIDPVSDADTVLTELILADMATVEKALGRARKEAQGSKEMRPFLEALELVDVTLAEGRPVREAGLDAQQLSLVRGLHLLTQKPLIYVLNVDEEPVGVTVNLVPGVETVPICAKLEAELADLEESDREEFLQELGIGASGLDRLVKSCYRLLGLITFFTAQSNEARAWTVREGTKAPQAAGTIHSDFERGFIKAEVVDFETLDILGSDQAVKAAGRMRIEGKEYVVRDGDVIHFRFNV